MFLMVSTLAEICFKCGVIKFSECSDGWSDALLHLTNHEKGPLKNNFMFIIKDEVDCLVKYFIFEFACLICNSYDFKHVWKFVMCTQLGARWGAWRHVCCWTNTHYKTFTKFDFFFLKSSLSAVGLGRVLKLFLVGTLCPTGFQKEGLVQNRFCGLKL